MRMSSKSHKRMQSRVTWGSPDRISCDVCMPSLHASEGDISHLQFKFN
uniref:Uncharacterized protein n=1 Tax=Rhizophora mucronata TaxID=61149 RepID=A0A2P2NRG1_RHIMU